MFKKLFKNPIVWLLASLAVVAAYVLVVAPKIGEYSANQTFETNLTELQVKTKALADKLKEPAGQALAQASKEKVTSFQALIREYTAASPDETKTAVVLDKVIALVAETRTVLATQDESMQVTVQEFNVALSVVIMRNPQLFAKRQQEVSNVVEETMKLYAPIANAQRVLDTIDSSVNSLLLRSGKGQNPTPEDVAAAQKEVVKMILDRTAAARRRAPQN